VVERSLKIVKFRHFEKIVFKKIIALVGGKLYEKKLITLAWVRSQLTKISKFGGGDNSILLLSFAQQKL
jgi:hypothetical protein